MYVCLLLQELGKAVCGEEEFSGLSPGISPLGGPGLVIVERVLHIPTMDLPHMCMCMNREHVFTCTYA